jgi:hypothetical protein
MPQVSSVSLLHARKQSSHNAPRSLPHSKGARQFESVRHAEHFGGKQSSRKQRHALCQNRIMTTPLT